jgi:hypothetical protein
MGEESLRRIAAAVLFLFALGVGLDTGGAQAQDGLATFNITNTARYTIFLKFYSQNRPWAWPGPSDHWILDDSQEHSFRLACNIGEKICYGGGYSQDGNGSYWGVGFLGNHGCTSCCLVCGANNPTGGWSLND